MKLARGIVTRTGRDKGESCQQDLPWLGERSE
jgi:hypothetical protein